VLPVSDYHKDKNPAYEMTKVRPPIYIRALNDWLKGFCDQRGYTYLDYYSAMVDSSGMLKADLADDGLHPNSAGYRVMAPLALQAIRKTVGTSQQPKGKKKRLFQKSE
jgi:lysophospholipase L1-like esterase